MACQYGRKTEVAEKAILEASMFYLRKIVLYPNFAEAMPSSSLDECLVLRLTIYISYHQRGPRVLSTVSMSRQVLERLLASLPLVTCGTLYYLSSFQADQLPILVG